MKRLWGYNGVRYVNILVMFDFVTVNISFLIFQLELAYKMVITRLLLVVGSSNQQCFFWGGCSFCFRGLNGCIHV